MKPAVLLALVASALAAQQTGPIPFGSALDADRQIAESQQLVKETKAPQPRAKGDQHRTYHFAATKTDMPYRLYVPATWDDQSKLPLIVMLHGAGADENRYLDMNNQQMIRLAEQHGYVLASPLGLSPLGAYGTPLKPVPGTLHGEPGCANRQADFPARSHTLSTSRHPLLAQLVASARENCPGADLRSDDGVKQ